MRAHTYTQTHSIALTHTHSKEHTYPPSPDRFRYIFAVVGMEMFGLPECGNILDSNR